MVAFDAADCQIPKHLLTLAKGREGSLVLRGQRWQDKFLCPLQLRKRFGQYLGAMAIARRFIGHSDSVIACHWWRS